jgi:hypothetical protein
LPSTNEGEIECSPERPRRCIDEERIDDPELAERGWLLAAWIELAEEEAGEEERRFEGLGRLPVIERARLSLREEGDDRMYRGDWVLALREEEVDAG